MDQVVQKQIVILEAISYHTGDKPTNVTSGYWKHFIDQKLFELRKITQSELAEGGVDLGGGCEGHGKGK